MYPPPIRSHHATPIFRWKPCPNPTSHFLLPLPTSSPNMSSLPLQQPPPNPPSPTAYRSSAVPTPSSPDHPPPQLPQCRSLARRQDRRESSPPNTIRVHRSRIPPSTFPARSQM